LKRNDEKLFFAVDVLFWELPPFNSCGSSLDAIDQVLGSSVRVSGKWGTFVVIFGVYATKKTTKNLYPVL